MATKIKQFVLVKILQGVECSTTDSVIKHKDVPELLYRVIKGLCIDILCCGCNSVPSSWSNQCPATIKKKSEGDNTQQLSINQYSYFSNTCFLLAKPSQAC